MTPEGPSSASPRLRFPEFRAAGNWGFRQLKSVAEPISEKVGTSECVPMSVTTGVGLVSQEEKFGRVIAGDSYKNYIRLRMNDFAYNKSATKEFPQGYIARYTGTRDAGVPNSIFTCFRPDADSVIPEFLDHLFQSNYHGRWLRKYITVGARAHGALSVSNDHLFAMMVPFPPSEVSLAEQKKIASCLDSLDDLIAAEGRKLDALRRHQHGLMQQLFPQSSETVPRLRFPQFEDAPEWIRKTLGSEGEFLSALTGKTAADFDTGDARFIPYTNVYENTFIDTRWLRSVNVTDIESQNPVRKGDVFFTVSSETQQDAGMASVLLDDIADCYVNSFCAMFRPDARGEIDSRFLGYLLRSEAVRGYLAANAQGSTRFNIGKKVFRELPICIPSRREQEAIAECLDALDQQIARQGAWINSLRSHEEGLLQQLFPHPQEETL